MQLSVRSTKPLGERERVGIGVASVESHDDRVEHERSIFGLTTGAIRCRCVPALREVRKRSWFVRIAQRTTHR
jgi:hypothetical protein